VWADQCSTDTCDRHGDPVRQYVDGSCEFWWRDQRPFSLSSWLPALRHRMLWLLRPLCPENAPSLSANEQPCPCVSSQRARNGEGPGAAVAALRLSRWFVLQGSHHTALTGGPDRLIPIQHLSVAVQACRMKLSRGVGPAYSAGR
jgi:hypothetical protein